MLGHDLAGDPVAAQDLAFSVRVDVRAATGAEALVGQRAVVSSPSQVRVAGEIWRARSLEPLVVEGQGPRLVVRCRN